MGAKENGEGRFDRSTDHSTDFEKEIRSVKEGESDYEPAKDTLSSHNSEECSKATKNLNVPKKNAKKESGGSYLRPTKVSISRQEQKNLQMKSSNNGLNKSHKSHKVVSSILKGNIKNTANALVPLRSSSVLCEGTDDKTIEEVKEIDFLDEVPIGDQIVVSDDSIAGAEGDNLDDAKPSVYQKVEEMEIQIEMLEEELREVAALEISLYSFIPEHGSSVHKVHTPARRLARLYIHACKHSSQDMLATVAKNTVSGLALIAKSCGNDVPRLTFWLSNTVILREIISQDFVSSTRSSAPMRPADSNSCAIKSCSWSQLIKLKNRSEGKQGMMRGFFQQINDWQDTSTFIAALEKLESWIFSRAVESVWWQALTPHMHIAVEDLCYAKSFSKLLKPCLGDPKLGNFSVNLWRSALHDAFSKLCPVRSAGHDCGCLPILARMVMEQCVRRLDVAMFNAILRVSANEMPTDPISDPIVDPKVLPIPAGNLSFGSGAQLKNAIGSWARWMEELLDMDADIYGKDNSNEDDGSKRGDSGIKFFCYLNELSDLLMLPKDMLLEKTIRNEVFPSIGLPLITRILCNFTPDEFCPDPVPCIVLEMLNSESLSDPRPAGHEQSNIYPLAAAPVVYSPLLLPDIIDKLFDADNKSPALQRKTSMVLRKGYASDEDLDDLDDPLASFVDRIPPVSPAIARDTALQKQVSVSNFRYHLLREVWRD